MSRLSIGMSPPWGYEADVSSPEDPPWIRVLYTTSVRVRDESGRQWLHAQCFDCDNRGVVDRNRTSWAGDDDQFTAALNLVSHVRAYATNNPDWTPGDAGGWPATLGAVVGTMLNGWREIDPAYGSPAYVEFGIEAMWAQREREDDARGMV